MFANACRLAGSKEDEGENSTMEDVKHWELGHSSHHSRYPVQSSGCTLSLPSPSLLVAEACSGTRRTRPMSNRIKLSLVIAIHWNQSHYLIPPSPSSIWQRPYCKTPMDSVPKRTQNMFMLQSTFYASLYLLIFAAVDRIVLLCSFMTFQTPRRCT
jgi:hypothetical protein